MADEKNTAGCGETVRIAAEHLEMVPIEKLVPYARNARTHSSEQIAQLRSSLREFGFVAPIVIDKNFNVIAGHGRLLAARAEGMNEVPCVLASNLTEAQRKAYILADNRLAEKAGWDMEFLKLELQDLQEMAFDTGLTGFTMEELPDDSEGDDLPPAVDDGYDGSLPEVCTVKDGDVFHLGRHVLVCGDCTLPGTVKAFPHGGANLLLTDPPYNIDYVGKTADALTVKNDNLPDSDFMALLKDSFRNAEVLLAPGSAFYIWFASTQALLFLNVCSDIGWTVRQILCWNKNSFTLGRQDYQWKYEPCLYGWMKGAAHYWNGGRAQSTVLDFDRPVCSEEHPTMKPIPLFDRLIRNSCPKDGVVYDPFGGSGTALLACEQNGRTCWMVESEPRNCQIVLNRWEKLTGRKAKN